MFCSLFFIQQACLITNKDNNRLEVLLDAITRQDEDGNVIVIFIGEKVAQVSPPGASMDDYDTQTDQAASIRHGNTDYSSTQVPKPVMEKPKSGRLRSNLSVLKQCIRRELMARLIETLAEVSLLPKVAFPLKETPSELAFVLRFMESDEKTDKDREKAIGYFEAVKRIVRPNHIRTKHVLDTYLSNHILEDPKNMLPIMLLWYTAMIMEIGGPLLSKNTVERHTKNQRNHIMFVGDNWKESGPRDWSDFAIHSGIIGMAEFSVLFCEPSTTRYASELPPRNLKVDFKSEFDQGLINFSGIDDDDDLDNLNDGSGGVEFLGVAPSPLPPAELDIAPPKGDQGIQSELSHCLISVVCCIYDVPLIEPLLSYVSLLSVGVKGDQVPNVNQGKDVCDKASPFGNTPISSGASVATTSSATTAPTSNTTTATASPFGTSSSAPTKSEFSSTSTSTSTFGGGSSTKNPVENVGEGEDGDVDGAHSYGEEDGEGDEEYVYDEDQVSCLYHHV